MKISPHYIWGNCNAIKYGKHCDLNILEIKFGTIDMRIKLALQLVVINYNKSNQNLGQW